MVCIRYRARQPRASPVWQVLPDHAAKLPGLSAATTAAIEAFLECGDLHAGFTRLQCPDCRHEFLCPFSCKQRGLCASCHQHRTLIEGAVIADTICAAVPHRHIVLTIPRLIRNTFKFDRALLDELYHTAHLAITAWLRYRTGQAEGQPGLVVAVHTFGDFLFWHPHVNVLVAAGVFAPNGDFHLSAPRGWQELAELLRHTILRRLRDASALADWQVAKLKNWRHSGFSVDAGEAPIAAADATGRRRLAEYLLRAPFSLEKITYNSDTGAILYRSARHWRTKRNFEVFSASQFIVALVAQIPPKGVPAVRYYGWYSNKSRGLRARAGATGVGQTVSPPPLHRRRRAAWRDLIREVWGADPLKCPICGGTLRTIALVESQPKILAILAPLGLARPHARPCAAGPPRPEVAVLLDAGDGAADPAETPPAPPDLLYPKPRDEAIRFRSSTLDPGENFEQCGFELAPWAAAPAADAARIEMFAEHAAQPDAADGEPVFWNVPGGDAYPDENFVQGDVAD
jgi:hypothetical protein